MRVTVRATEDAIIRLLKSRATQFQIILLDVVGEKFAYCIYAGRGCTG